MIVRQARSTPGGDSTFRHIHAGIPALSGRMSAKRETRSTTANS